MENQRQLILLMESHKAYHHQEHQNRDPEPPWPYSVTTAVTCNSLGLSWITCQFWILDQSQGSMVMEQGLVWHGESVINNDIPFLCNVPLSKTDHWTEANADSQWMTRKVLKSFTFFPDRSHNFKWGDHSLTSIIFKANHLLLRISWKIKKGVLPTGQCKSELPHMRCRYLFWWADIIISNSALTPQLQASSALLQASSPAD